MATPKSPGFFEMITPSSMDYALCLYGPWWLRGFGYSFLPPSGLSRKHVHFLSCSPLYPTLKSRHSSAFSCQSYITSPVQVITSSWLLPEHTSSTHSPCFTTLCTSLIFYFPSRTPFSLLIACLPSVNYLGKRTLSVKTLPSFSLCFHSPSTSSIIMLVKLSQTL